MDVRQIAAIAAAVALMIWWFTTLPDAPEGPA